MAYKLRPASELTVDLSETITREDVEFFFEELERDICVAKSCGYHEVYVEYDEVIGKFIKLSGFLWSKLTIEDEEIRRTFSSAGYRVRPALFRDYFIVEWD